MTIRGWTFLTNHGHVLVCVARDPDSTIREIANRVGITERAVQKIVSDLEASETIARFRVGRRNRYVVRRDATFRHPVESDLRVGEFVGLVATEDREAATASTAS
jgi:DNA-binding Lrp family transcriptional regulator